MHLLCAFACVLNAQGEQGLTMQSFVVSFWECSERPSSVYRAGAGERGRGQKEWDIMAAGPQGLWRLLHPQTCTLNTHSSSASPAPLSFTAYGKRLAHRKAILNLCIINIPQLQTELIAALKLRSQPWRYLHTNLLRGPPMSKTSIKLGPTTHLAGNCSEVKWIMTQLMRTFKTVVISSLMT